jgi:hypothetical protein
MAVYDPAMELAYAERTAKSLLICSAVVAGSLVASALRDKPRSAPIVAAVVNRCYAEPSPAIRDPAASKQATPHGVWFADHERLLEEDGVLILPSKYCNRQQLVSFRQLVRQAEPEFRGTVHALRCRVGGAALPLW